MRDRQFRRAEDRKHLKRTKKFLKSGWMRRSDEDEIDRIAKRMARNKKPCSCFMCGNPRKHFKLPTLKEKICTANTDE